MTDGNLTEPKSEIKMRIRSFYDDLRLHRGRTTTQAMVTCYYPKWVGAVLEIGAGILSPDYHDCIVMDISEVAVRHQADNGVSAVLGDVDFPPFRYGSFDTVACYNLLEHLPDPIGAIKGMCNISRRQVVIGGPNYIAGKLRSEAGWKDLLNFSFQWLLGAPRIPRLNPRLEWTGDFQKDQDAVSAVNVLAVMKTLKNSGFRVEAETLDKPGRGLKKRILSMPPFKFWGGMMWIKATAVKESAR